MAEPTDPPAPAGPGPGSVLRRRGRTNVVPGAPPRPRPQHGLQAHGHGLQAEGSSLQAQGSSLQAEGSGFHADESGLRAEGSGLQLDGRGLQLDGHQRAGKQKERPLDAGRSPLRRLVGPSSPRKWVQRAEGDRRAIARLRIIEDDDVVVLNDRRVPGSRMSIKLIAVAPAGVFVIDAKNYRGLVHTKRPGPLSNLGPHELHVGRRDCTSSLQKVSKQVDAVRAALASMTGGAEVPVNAMLCFTRAAWGFASAIEISDVWVGWPKLAAGRVHAPVVMDSPTVLEVSSVIAARLPVT